MNLISFGFSEKGTPVFLNQEPFTKVGTMYLMKAGNNTVVGITLDDNFKSNGRRKRSPRAKTVAAEAAPAPKKRARRVKAETAEAAPKRKKAGKPRKARVKKEKPVKEQKAVEAV